MACATGGPPRLEVTGGLANDAATRAGELVTARYEIHNAGERDLLLHGLALGCGCRLESPFPDALAPDGRASFAVRCRVPPTPGEVVRELRLFSSDPSRAEERLRISVRVPAGSAADPPALYFGYVAIGHSAARELVLGPMARDASRAPAEASGAPAGAAEDREPVPVAADPALSVERRPPRTDGRRVYLVRFTPRAPGPLRTVLTLEPGSGEVPVAGVGFATVLAFPAEVILPSAATAHGSFTIALKAIGAEPLTITSVDLPAGLAGALVPTTPGREWRLALRVSGPRPRDAQPIRLHTTADDEPVVEIAVRPGDTS